MQVHGAGSHLYDRPGISNLAAPGFAAGGARAIESLPSSPAANDEAVLQYALNSDIARLLGNLSHAHSGHRADLDRVLTALSAARFDSTATGYASYTNAAAAAQAAINLSAYVTAAAEAGLDRLEDNRLPFDTYGYIKQRSAFGLLGRAARDAASRLWMRAPLLVLLLSWFALGLSAGAVMLLLRAAAPASSITTLLNDAFNLWGLGFVALAGFGFYARVRNVRF
jgi:hypothetical protein